MKNKILILFIVICGFLTISSNQIYAYDNELIGIEINSSMQEWDLEKEGDRYYLIYFNHRSLNYKEFDSSVKVSIDMNTTFDKFRMVNNQTGEVLFEVKDFDQLEINAANIDLHILNIIVDGKQSKVDFNKALVMYFEISNELKEIDQEVVLISDVNHPIAANDFKNFFVAVDKNDGDVSSSMVIVEDEYTGNEHILGDYQMVIKANDNAGNIALLSYTISVRDFESPKVEPLEIIKISYKDSIDYGELFDNIKAIDNYDQQSSISYDLVADTYKYGYANKLGLYELTFKVTDSSGNSTYVKQQIEVIDDVRPVISGKTLYEIEQFEDLSMDEVLGNLTFTDEIDGDNVEVVIENNPLDVTKVGSYDIELAIYDQSENIAYLVIVVDVKDTTAPSFFINLNQMTVSGFDILTDDDILTFVKSQVLLEYDSINITMNEYKNHEKESGIYRVQLSLKDKGFETKLQLLVNVDRTQLLDEEAVDQSSTIAQKIVGFGFIGIAVIGTCTFIFLKRKKLI
ncbi:hypothetical protein JV173_03250 [Acholeplasma equirhinis]|uniref:hypothetical protein n=1 Tax=Acholeplasma equirhinis TaxID=555393 RepID=UPI00197AC6A4|nr:hypothetical protein [Acholeplasma equirhinis]MBN3490526.1 hypothetical protein [Acholeplasma equirhinis]